MIAISDNDTAKFKEYAPFRLLRKRNRRKGEEMKNSDLQKEDVRKQYKPQKSKPLRFNTRVLYAGRLQRVKQWGGNYHVHDFLEVVLVLRGSGEIITDDGKILIEQGDIVVYI